MRPDQSRTITASGAHGEGGGALFRTLLQMAALTQQGLVLHSIRGAMRRPGLNAEDLTFLLALGESTGQNFEELSLGSDRLVFQPAHGPKPLRATLDVHAHDKGTHPGSACVVGHALLPVLSQAGAISRLTIIGETHGSSVLSYDSFEQGTLTLHQRQGLYSFPSLVEAGFGFGSRGKLHLEIEPGPFESVQWLKRGQVKECGVVVTYNHEDSAALEEQAELAAEDLRAKGLKPIVDVHEVHAKDKGASLTVWARCERGGGTGSAHLGKGLAIHHMADTALRSFNDWYDSEAALDPYVADQVLIPAAFAPEKTVFTTSQLTRRLTTMVWAIKQFLPIKATVLGREGEPGTITLER
jgi:RNA 3'-terminal phosphate cyclase